MNFRPIDWRDLPVLHRYRDQCLFFDSTLALTRGSILTSARALFPTLASATGVFTYLGVDNEGREQPVLGQVIYPLGATSARLACLAPETALELAGAEALLDYMTCQIGERGAFHVLAEVDECLKSCETLHGMGFAIYTRQRIWQLTNDPAGEALPTPWRPCTDQDVIGIRSLYNNVTPGLVQQVEALPNNRSRRMVYYQGQDLLAYVDIKLGPCGIWIQPFIHPNVENLPARLAHLWLNLPNRRSRPVYLCVRSYQSWLEPAMEELGAQPSPRQAVMVKRLALSRRAVQPFALPALEGKQAEPTVPIAQADNGK